jgi:opacity protein-like surface antigen
VIAGYLTRTQSGAIGSRVKEPVTFGVAGIKYRVATGSKAEPYMLAGLGVARYTEDVRFTIGGADVTANLASYGVVLGSDLSGDFTSALMTLGGGVEWPLWQQLMIDFQYRYGRIFAKDEGINSNRVGIGVGVRF